MLLALLISLLLPPVALLVRPQVAFAPADLQVEIRTPRHTDNRRVCAVLASDDFVEQQSCRTLDGGSPVAWSFRWKHVEVGNYTAYAVLQRGAERFESQVSAVKVR